MKRIITQKQWVKGKLFSDGSVTRNQAIRNGITRLGARIYDLKNEGMTIEGKRLPLRDNGYDFIYYFDRRDGG